MDTPPIRRRLRRIEGDAHVRYLTFSCYRRLPLFSNDRIKPVFINRLDRCRKEHDVALFAWVIMPEHIHLLVYPARFDATMERFTHGLKRPVAETVLRRWKQLAPPILARLRHGNGHRFWQTGGGYDRNIFSDDELLEKITYIEENPVRRRLADTPVDYPWSSARHHTGRPDALLTCDPLPW